MNKNSTILYVEDEKDIREEMIEVLSLEFKNIYTAKDGAEGLAMYKKYNPDLVITDVQMPSMNGIEMSKEILLLNSDANIILITAFNEESFVSDAQKIGIKDYINKPIDIKQLFKSIYNV